MGARLELGLLGKLHIAYNDRPVADDLLVKAQAMLCYLAVTREAHSRHALAGLLWGDISEDKAKNNLRVTLANLRKICPEHVIVTHSSVAFNSDSDYSLDLDNFESAVRDLDASDIATQQHALQLYRGDFLEDFFVERAVDFEEWLLGQRAHWQNRAQRLLDRLADVLLSERDYTSVLDVLRRRLDIEPWHEEAHRQLMLVYARIGDYNAALAQYETCRRLLEEELNVEPMQETTQLYERIQIARRGRPSHLPVDATPFIGRTSELRQLHRMLLDPDHRLLSIIGLGGMGKTRLALAAAREADVEHAIEFINGVVFVSLIDAPSVAELPLTLASALKLALSGNKAPVDELLDYLRNKEMLLVLDNFEHLLLETAQGENALDLVNRILRTCHTVKILVTSREPLHAASEWRFDLEGLETLEVLRSTSEHSGEAETSRVLAQSSAQLFVQTAQQVRPNYELNDVDAPHVHELCRIVAGMPLAIQLAAAWLRVMPVENIVTEVSRSIDILASNMRDASPRQRSMRAVFDHTWSLLDESEQRVLQALSIFRGGFSAEAAREVAQATPFVLAALVDRGLLQVSVSGARYSMHELTRQYAAEMRDQQALVAATLEEDYARYYIEFVHDQESNLHNAHQAQTYALLRQDAGNIRQAWQWAVKHHRAEMIEAALDGMYEFYLSQSWFIDGEALFAQAVEALIAATDSTSTPPLHARLLVRHAAYLRRLGNYEQAQNHFERSLAISYRLEDLAMVAQAHQGMSEMALSRGRYAEAIEWGEQALAQCAELGDQPGIARSSTLLGQTLGMQSKYDEARAHLQRGSEIYQAMGDRFNLAPIFRSLGTIALGIGHFDESAADYLQALDLLNQLDVTRSGNTLLNNLGTVAWARGDREEARRYYEECLLISREIGDRHGQSLGLAGLALVARGADNFSEALRYAQRSLTLAREIDNQERIAWSLKIVGEIERDQRHFDAARQWLEESLTMYEKIGNQDNVAHLLSLLAGLANDVEDYVAVKDYAYRCLRVAYEIRSEASMMDGLLDLSAALVHDDDWSRAGLLLSVVVQHPATHDNIRTQAKERLDKVSAHLSAKYIAAAQSQAQSIDLWELAAELLANKS